eukprot:m.192800 g.192800  ORF g.192800 m.192800 type:complete len:518 (-) comp18741_c0_seq1:104-1657(-)
MTARCVVILCIVVCFPSSANTDDLSDFLTNRVVSATQPVTTPHSASSPTARRKQDPPPTHPTFVKAFDRAVPRALLPRLLQDAEVAHALAESTPKLQYGKRATYYRPVTITTLTSRRTDHDEQAADHAARAGGNEDAGLRSRSAPRFATEEMIDHLRRVSFGSNNVDADNVVGAEWWYQVLPEDGSIGFHYDKDEGVASTEMRMRFPHMSTVTYLTGTGGPTVILNMTTLDGNHHTPPVASVGYLSFPVVGRHTVFDGRLVHGVLAAPTEGKRVTLLVNWWTHESPRPPNCREVTAHEVAKFVAASGPPSATADVDGDVVHQPLELTGDVVKPGVIPTAELNQGVDVSINIGLQTHFLRLPRQPPQNGFGRLRWQGTQSLGAVIMVDLADQRVRHLLETPSGPPKVIYFVKAGGLPDAKATFFPAVKRLPHPMLAFVAEWRPSTKALWERVGLRHADAPTVGVMLDGSSSSITMLPRDGNGHRPSVETIVHFVSEHISGTTAPRSPSSSLPRDDHEL